MMRLRLLSAADVIRALPMAEAIAAMKAAFAQLSTGQAGVPLRSQLPVLSHEGTVLFMPAYLAQSDDLAMKIVSVFPQNSRLGLPTLHALVVVLEAETGRPAAVMDGAALTAIRTGAASGAATDLLARPDARYVAILGSGAQARTQLEAVCTVRSIERVSIYSPSLGHAQGFAHEMAGRAPIPADVRVASSPDQAVSEADIVCAATTSPVPVFDGQKLKPGIHVNGVGSFTPGMQEIDAATVTRSDLIVVDSRASALAEAGDLLIPLRQGLISEAQLVELGEIVAGLKPGRTSPQQITFFKSVGVAVQDAVAARRALEAAERLSLGVTVEL